MPDNIPEVQPLEGKTTIDDKLFFEPERLSYESARHLAAEIARRVGADVKGRVVVVAGTPLLADFANLAALHSTLDALATDYRAVRAAADELGAARAPDVSGRVEAANFVAPRASVGDLPTAVAPALSAVLGLVSLFRQDVEFHGARTSVDALAFELGIAAALKDQGATHVYVPDLFVMNEPPAENSIRRKRQDVHAAKGEAWSSIAPFVGELVTAEAELDKALRAGTPAEIARRTARVEELRRDLDPITAQLTLADQTLRQIETDFQQRDDKTGLTALGRLVRAEALLNRRPVFVHAAIVSSGGHHKVSRNLLRTLFFGDGLSFMGGVVVRWGLLAEDGSVRNGGIESARFAGKFPSVWDRFRDALNEVSEAKPG